MDDERPSFILDQYWRDKAWNRAKRVVVDYETGKSDCRKAVRGIEKDHETLAFAKMSEAALALHCDLDPETAIRWKDGSGYKEGEADHDLIVGDWRIDVKGTDMHCTKLIWPFGKNDDYKKKKFDYLVLVKYHRRTHRFQIWGEMEKWEFERRHDTADLQRHPRMIPGTWFMEQKEIPGFTLHKRAAAAAADRWRKLREAAKNTIYEQLRLF